MYSRGAAMNFVVDLCMLSMLTGCTWTPTFLLQMLFSLSVFFSFFACHDAHANFCCLFFLLILPCLYFAFDNVYLDLVLSTRHDMKPNLHYLGCWCLTLSKEKPFVQLYGLLKNVSNLSSCFILFVSCSFMCWLLSSAACPCVDVVHCIKEQHVSAWTVCSAVSPCVTCLLRPYCSS